MFSYGKEFRITIYGSSHDSTIGLIIDGLKPGMKIDVERIMNDLTLRRPSEIGTTKRVELDSLEIKNGLKNGKTTGASLHIEIENKSIIKSDYDNLINHPRPNHADFVANYKYHGNNDYSGGGFFSGRMTSLFVVAGSIAKMILPYTFESKITQIGELTDISMIDEYLNKIKDENDSVGGIVKIRIKNVDIGLGDPIFNKMDAMISHLILTVPGTRGIIFGDDFDVSKKGSENNDLIISRSGETLTNHSGGIVGGITNGNDIVFNVYVKPTSSISKPQNTFNFKTNEVSELKIIGRHDVAFVRRIPIVLESVAAIVLADFYMKKK